MKANLTVICLQLVSKVQHKTVFPSRSRLTIPYHLPSFDESACNMLVDDFLHASDFIFVFQTGMLLGEQEGLLPSFTSESIGIRSSWPTQRLSTPIGMLR